MALQQPPSLVGDVLERTTTSKPPPHPHNSPFSQGPSKTGFPQAQHRSQKKSAFARAREAANANKDKRVIDHAPVVVPAKSSVISEKAKAQDEPQMEDDWRAQMSRENELRVGAMSEKEREEERTEILERFGPGIGDLLKKVREARTSKSSGHSLFMSAPIPSVLSTPSSTRPASRASKQLRFAEVMPSDVHVYESAPSSPRKKALALPPPDADDPDVVSLGTLAPDVSMELVLPPPDAADVPMDLEPEEGTPEYIRRRFFPSAPAHNPDLAWMEDPPSSSAPPPDLLRFDLSGNPLAAPLHSSLPTHLGLHHHAPDADGMQRAGYTLSDVFTTAHSSVRAQRVAGMRMLAGVARWVGAVARGDADLLPGTIKPTEIGDVKARVLAAGIGALAERGALGVHAVEVVWECVVGSEEVSLQEGVELGKKEDDFPLKQLLSQIVAALTIQSESPDSSTSSRILAILDRLARHTNEITTEIVSAHNLITVLFRTFLLTDPSTANPAALDLLITLASSTRSNAQLLTPPADALLRFVASLPPEGSAVLLTKTLIFYKALAEYGLYAHVASTAHMQLAAVAQYLVAQEDNKSKDHNALRVAWLRALEGWIVCATDPHATTPEHDILWSQVVAWGWGQDVLAMRERLSAEEEDWETWAAVWRAESAWLEGARVNGVRGGEAERLACVAAVKDGFEGGEGGEHRVVGGALSAFAGALKDFGTGGVVKIRLLSRSVLVLAAAMRLWLACLPPAADGPLSAPPFSLPFSRLSDLCAQLVSAPLWIGMRKSGSGYVLYRPLAHLLAIYLRFSQRLPDVSQDACMAQALSVLTRLMPGEEECAVRAVEELLGLVTPEWAAARGLTGGVPQDLWDRGGVGILKPFLVHAVHPREEGLVGPWCATPGSIKHVATLRLPPAASMQRQRDHGLPLRRDWTLSPLDHLLRSGTSPVFSNLPAGWDASEVDVTRAALLLTKIGRELTSRYSFTEFVLSREEAVFGCMKVFMLEHGQSHGDSSEEVFRDAVVGRLMNDLLAPYTVPASSSAVTDPSSPVVPSPPIQPNLEDVAIGFLGTGTPFYQYYTDFVALYDAISFAHPTFARLLLPPTAMCYAVDYRRHLWNDFAHVLKSVRTEPGDVVAGDLGEYLWPVETDAQMLGAYLRALVRSGGDGLHGFLRMVAVHHVACNVWPDLRENGAAVGAEERAEKLVRVVLDQGEMQVVRDVVLYRQVGAGRVRVPPDCFELSEEIKRERLGYVERVGGVGLVGRVEGLLQ
ncbi:hypothetical protein R3P38DRAFT_2601661 [Favolaschia claudopus]|uniref:RNA polymerase II-associated protein 1 C-terminal domain-containing protein n=1 Tax=Favolaschia claudopus TaxID=2862362 RepID=A0AAW0DPG3_9AGAR